MQKQGSRAGTAAFVAVGLAVAIGFIGMLVFKGVTGRYPWAQAGTSPTTKPIPGDVCGFIGKANLQEIVPNAELTSDPGGLDIPATCRAQTPEGRNEVVVDIRRFEDAAAGAGSVRARQWFDRFCAEAYSGTWAPTDPSAPPVPVVGQRICGNADGPTTLLVLQDRNVVHIWLKGWDSSERSELPGRAAELAKHVLQRLATLE